LNNQYKDLRNLKDKDVRRKEKLKLGALIEDLKMYVSSAFSVVSIKEARAKIMSTISDINSKRLLMGINGE